MGPKPDGEGVEETGAKIHPGDQEHQEGARKVEGDHWEVEVVARTRHIHRPPDRMKIRDPQLTKCYDGTGRGI